ncbi:GTP-binding protein [Evansella sp. AB-rgal1]|uniref:GTP-binding protein n=1 Tax=Evansella sp. AB-rgal1 TaxID=3242696 RepID=UPI00359E28A9
MKKTIGMLAHVDAGKTTFSEQLLYHTKSIRKRGRVDHRDTFLDSHEIEKERGITVFSGQAVTTFNDSTYYLIDTPGHVDFSPEMERAIQIMDYAVVIISAVEGVEGHTETVWRLLRKHGVPTFLFINKVDREGADVDRVLDEIRGNLTEDVCDITESLDVKGSMEETLIEFLAERDEDLLEQYMESGYDEERWLECFRTAIGQGIVFPCATGSALQDLGVKSFFEKLDVLTVTDYSASKREEFGARVYKVRHDESGTRLTFMKALSGELKVRDEVSYGETDERVTEKVTQIRVYNGTKFHAVDRVVAGELFAVTGVSGAFDGEGVGAVRERSIYDMVPTLKSKVVVEDGVNIKEVLRCFQLLDAEDSSLRVTWDETFQQVHISVMGMIQLEVLTEVVKERFGFAVRFGDPEILYKETIETEVRGYGHFEPLGHYAEVHVLLSPGEKNSGIVFENACHANDLSVGNQNLVRDHLFEREHHGLLTGSPVTDLKVTLLTGRAHNKHTSGGDFREATYRALRQGLEKASNVLLEPYYFFKIKVDLEKLGRVLSDVQQAHGTFDPPETMGEKAVVTGRVPVATFMNYSVEFAAITHGKGTLNMIFGGYDRCHNAEEVIERIGYNKDADPKYTSSSIFCAKGKGYTVRWDEAEQEMHA